MAGFWTYKALPPPTLAEAVAVGAIAATTTEAEWTALTPGMRRTVVKVARGRAARECDPETEFD